MPFDLLNQKCLFDHPIPVACANFETLEECLGPRGVISGSHAFYKFLHDVSKKAL
jgi:hypothetical protein